MDRTGWDNDALERGGPDLERETIRGEEARRILGSETFKGLIGRVRRKYQVEFEQLAIDDTKKMKQLKIKIMVLGEVLQDLHDAVETGTLAKAQIDAEAEQDRRQTAAAEGRPVQNIEEEFA